MADSVTKQTGEDHEIIPETQLVCRDIVCRWPQNPILTLADFPFDVNAVFNASAVKYNGEYLLLLRVEDLRGRSMFVMARSHDGIRFVIDPEPAMVPSKEPLFSIYERRGIEDPRITYLEDSYYIVYTAFSKYGSSLALARTQDFREFTRMGLISQPDNKDGALFPRKIKGKYARLDRPCAAGGTHMWISYSDDLINWGRPEIVMSARSGAWDSDRIGASVPPIETPDGWLEIYHGVKNTAAGPVYRLGVALLDLEDPTRVLARSAVPILSPREYYERIGDVNNVVFSCGAIVEPDGQVKIYYGAADTCICLGITTLKALFERSLAGSEDEPE